MIHFSMRMSIISCISKALCFNFAWEEENCRTAALGGWGALNLQSREMYLGESKNKRTSKFMTCVFDVFCSRRSHSSISTWNHGGWD